MPPIYSHNDNRVSETPTLVEVADDASCARVRKTFAAKNETPMYNISLWKPREYLNPRHGGPSDLRGRLLDNDCRLDAFCTNYFDHQGGVTPILDYILSIFKKFINLSVVMACIRDEFLHIPAHVVQLTAELMRTASQISTNQSALFQEFNPNKTNSDHILQFQRRSPPTVAAGVICEGKSRIGLERRRFHSMFFFVRSVLDTSEHFFQSAVFPTLPIVQRLTDYLWLVSSRANDDDHALCLYCQELPDSPSAQTARYFPDITEYGAGTKVVRFQYLQPLKIDEACVPRKARREEQVVIKFVQRYGASETHRLLASKGKAPALKFCCPISSNGKYWYGSLQMVVMEFLCGQTVAQKYEGSIAEEVRTAVRGAVQILHDQSLVHRDIHIPNVSIVDGAGDEGGG
ncbi:hypothetical protein ARMSODRAFT_1083091 [Armillaria solidipes]|uniref:Protein kinase domain-containing protein n=1 Tax=Armillaria solidipes TaxID=1076256 RepID=A0A2H3BLC0_9AGAR|nr:hypothetical protein ARMSODRAFT_1083091 [Armillaria solidipes]